LYLSGASIADPSEGKCPSVILPNFLPAAKQKHGYLQISYLLICICLTALIDTTSRNACLAVACPEFGCNLAIYTTHRATVILILTNVGLIICGTNICNKSTLLEHCKKVIKAGNILR
jgi:hypothetical protein